MDLLFRHTASEPVNWIHFTYDGTNEGWQRESGSNPPESLTMENGEFKYHMYAAKKSFEPCDGYDWNVDLPKSKDSLYQKMTPQEKVKFEKRLQEYWEKNQDLYGNPAKAWYLIMEGNKTGLYQNPWEFRNIRDEFYEDSAEGKTYSWKAGKFYTLEEAKTYIQFCRDEEGRHHGWPVKAFPIHWNKHHVP
jgi:hypothetical protein